MARLPPSASHLHPPQAVGPLARVLLCSISHATLIISTSLRLLIISILLMLVTLPGPELGTRPYDSAGDVHPYRQRHPQMEPSGPSGSMLVVRQVASTALHQPQESTQHKLRQTISVRQKYLSFSACGCLSGLYHYEYATTGSVQREQHTATYCGAEHVNHVGVSKPEQVDLLLLRRRLSVRTRGRESM